MNQDNINPQPVVSVSNSVKVLRQAFGSPPFAYTFGASPDHCGGYRGYVGSLCFDLCSRILDPLVNPRRSRLSEPGLSMSLRDVGRSNTGLPSSKTKGSLAVRRRPTGTSCGRKADRAAGDNARNAGVAPSGGGWRKVVGRLRTRLSERLRPPRRHLPRRQPEAPLGLIYCGRGAERHTRAHSDPFRGCAADLCGEDRNAGPGDRRRSCRSRLVADHPTRSASGPRLIVGACLPRSSINPRRSPASPRRSRSRAAPRWSGRSLSCARCWRRCAPEVDRIITGVRRRCATTLAGIRPVAGAVRRTSVATVRSRDRRRVVSLDSAAARTRTGGWRSGASSCAMLSEGVNVLSASAIAAGTRRPGSSAAFARAPAAADGCSSLKTARESPRSLGADRGSVVVRKADQKALGFRRVARQSRCRSALRLIPGQELDQHPASRLRADRIERCGEGRGAAPQIDRAVELRSDGRRRCRCSARGQSARASRRSRARARPREAPGCGGAGTL